MLMVGFPLNDHVWLLNLYEIPVVDEDRAATGFMVSHSVPSYIK